MQFDDDVDDARRSKKYDFANLKGGVSLWVETHADRVGVMKAFEAWKNREGSRLEATSRKVDKTDKRGPGYRVFFNAREDAARPIVASTVRKNTGREGHPFREFILNFTGLHTDEDVLEAVMSVDPQPKTISQTANSCLLLWKGETPKQIEYCLQRYGRTFEEIEAEKRKEAERINREYAEKQAGKATRLEEIKRQEAEAMAALARELGE